MLMHYGGRRGGRPGQGRPVLAKLPEPAAALVRGGEIGAGWACLTAWHGEPS